MAAIRLTDELRALYARRQALVKDFNDVPLMERLRSQKCEDIRRQWGEIHAAACQIYLAQLCEGMAVEPETVKLKAASFRVQPGYRCGWKVQTYEGVLLFEEGCFELPPETSTWYPTSARWLTFDNRQPIYARWSGDCGTGRIYSHYAMNLAAKIRDIAERRVHPYWTMIEKEAANG